MQSTSKDKTNSSLVNIVVDLICGTQGVSLIDFSDELEKVIKQFGSDESSVEKLKDFLVKVQEALRINDLVLLLDVVYSFSKNEGVVVIAKAD